MHASCFPLSIVITLVTFSPANTAFKSSAPGGGQVQPTAIPAGWHQYAPAGATFQVALPGKPTVEEIPGLPEAGIGGVRRADAVSPTALGFAVIDYEILDALEVGDGQSILESLEEAYLGLYPGHVRVQRSLSVHGLPARELVIDMPGEGVMYVRLVLASDRLYVLLVGVPEGIPESADIDRFFDSFQPASASAETNSVG